MSRPPRTRQYARIVDVWVKEIGFDPAWYGTHSIRRNKPTLIYRPTIVIGPNVGVVMNTISVIGPFYARQDGRGPSGGA